MIIWSVKNVLVEKLNDNVGLLVQTINFILCFCLCRDLWSGKMEESSSEIGVWSRKNVKWSATSRGSIGWRMELVLYHLVYHFVWYGALLQVQSCEILDAYLANKNQLLSRHHSSQLRNVLVFQTLFRLKVVSFM